jgi:SPP1 family predicted phage head-tail adaptor
MLAHRLRHRVTIQEQHITHDPDTNARSVSWAALVVDGVTLSDVPAEVLTGPGREFYQSGAWQGERAARMHLRWFPGLTHSMRILWEGVPYDIQSIETDMTARREYRLRCVAVGSDVQ